MIPTLSDKHGIVWMLMLAIASSPITLSADQLRIVVIEGEGAVNVIQQKTAVSPVIEVRDQNNQPVAGAVVRFAIQSGKATFSGAKTLTVTTDAAGRAAVTGLTPAGSGGLQITASAGFQGQTAAVTIAQTNVATTAQAAAGTGGASGGGGVSLTTIGIIGGVAAAGAVAGTKVLGGGGTTFTGSFSGPLVMLFPSTTSQGVALPTCTRTEMQTGTLEMDLEVNGEAVTGTALVDGKVTVTGVGGGASCGEGPVRVGSTGNIQSEKTPVNGGSANLSFKHDETWTNPPSAADPGGSTNTVTVVFSGALNADVITGTLTITNRTLPTNPNLLPGGALGGNAFGGTGSISFAMTLR